MRKIYNMLSFIISVTVLAIKDSRWLWQFLDFKYAQAKPLGLAGLGVENNYSLNRQQVKSNLEHSRYDVALDAALYANLQQLMEREKIYRNPNLNRGMVVKRLGTNKKKFLEVLQRNINMNFIDYINTYRLSDAVSLLQKSEYTNETIAFEVGFGSINTFYRQFRSRYGLSPAEYKKSVLFKEYEDMKTSTPE